MIRRIFKYLRYHFYKKIIQVKNIIFFVFPVLVMAFMVSGQSGCQKNNDSHTPEISASAAEVTEGDNSNVFATVNLTLSSPQSEPVILDYQTSDSTAVAGKDFVGIENGSFTFHLSNALLKGDNYGFLKLG